MVGRAGHGKGPPSVEPTEGHGSPDFRDPKVYALARRLFFRRFNERLKAAGLDEDDAFQDTLVILVRRSTMPSRWNPARGASLVKWLFMNMSGIAKNLADKEKRAQRRNGRPGAGRDVGDWMGREVPRTSRALSAVDVVELAQEMDVPQSVVAALAQGGDVFDAAVDAGCEPEDAAAIAWALS
jgi:hypothetical protein